MGLGDFLGKLLCQRVVRKKNRGEGRGGEKGNTSQVEEVPTGQAGEQRKALSARGLTPMTALP